MCQNSFVPESMAERTFFFTLAQALKLSFMAVCMLTACFSTSLNCAQGRQAVTDSKLTKARQTYELSRGTLCGPIGRGMRVNQKKKKKKKELSSLPRMAPQNSYSRHVARINQAQHLIRSGSQSRRPHHGEKPGDVHGRDDSQGNSIKKASAKQFRMRTDSLNLPGCTACRRWGRRWSSCPWRPRA